MTYIQAIVIAVFQGVTELFPVSSLGHSVLLPAWIGGSWSTMVTQSSQSTSESSFYLAYIVALHCATALTLLWFFRNDWIRIVKGLFRSAMKSVRARHLVIEETDERLAWMIVVATIPVALTGLLLEHTFRTIFAKPLAAAIFLTVNGLILLAGERYRRKGVALKSDLTFESKEEEAEMRDEAHEAGPRSRVALRLARESDARITGRSFGDVMVIGFLQILALFAGISRSGVTIVGGLWRGLDHEDAARFAFLLATPPILAAGLLKIPSLTGPAGAHIHGQVIVGVIVCAITAYFSVRFLLRYFETRTLTPFAVYCLVAGAASIIRFGVA